MALVDPIDTRGLDIQEAARKGADAASRVASEAPVSAAELIADKARSLVPSGPSGNAKASLRAMGATVAFGGSRAPYAPWLDFGGKVGIGKSVERRYIPGGRYLWPTLANQTRAIDEAMAESLADAITNSGLEVT